MLPFMVLTINNKKEASHGREPNLRECKIMPTNEKTF